MNLWNRREPDFVIGDFKFHLSPVIPDDAMYIVCGNNVVVSRTGKWRSFTREQLEARIKEVLQQ